MFEVLTNYIEKIKDAPVGEMIIKTSDGTPCLPYVEYPEVVQRLEQAVYNFAYEHPEYGLTSYGQIMEKAGIDLEHEYINSIDVSEKNAQCVLALMIATIRAERFGAGALSSSLGSGAMERWLRRLKEIDEEGDIAMINPMSSLELINGSCADQMVEVVVNAANSGLWAGGGICGVIFRKAGMDELTNACQKYKTPLKDGEAVITPAFNMVNAKAIIHAVGPNFGSTPEAFKELFDAYYNSLITMMNNGYHSIAFPLISAGLFGGALENPAAESTKQCCLAYKKFREDYPEYYVMVRLCAFTSNEMNSAKAVFEEMNIDVYV